MPRSQRTSSRPVHHANNNATSFINPWLSAALPTWAEVFQSSFPFGWYNKATLHGHRKARKIKVVRPDWGYPNDSTSSGIVVTDTPPTNSQSIIGTWLGHASALVDIPPLQGGNDDSTSASASSTPKQKSIHLLFDPIFSTRAGPTQYQGVARFKEPPCKVAELPGCDAVFISHNHYDHLDVASIKAIFRQFPHARYFVGLGIKSWLLATINIAEDQVVELDWWQDREFGISDLGLTAGSAKKQPTLKVSCVPAQHNSGRSPADQGCTLWCGWVVERFSPREQGSSSLSQTTPQPTRKGAIYHAGDTGYRRHAAPGSPICPIFTAIGERFGPLDLCFLPIWRGGSLGFISYMGLRLSHHDIPAALHASPTDAADMHLEVKARSTIGIHFGTFVGSENETVEAVTEFADACEGRGIRWLDEPSEGERNEKEEGDVAVEACNGRAGVLNIGESLVVDIL